MSVDLWLEEEQEPPCPTCGRRDPHDPDNLFEANFTYNYGPMWVAATGRGGGTVDVDGLTGEESAPIFGRAIAAVEEDPAKFVALEPSNKWGTQPLFLERLRECFRACQDYPRARWRSCR